MVIAEVTDVQQVPTRSKGKVAECETQEAIRKQATEWIRKANEPCREENRPKVELVHQGVGTGSSRTHAPSCT